MDDQGKHDLKWVGIWGATTLNFALIGHFRPQRLVDGGPITGCFFYFYGVASYYAWRDRAAQAERDDEDAGSACFDDVDPH